MTSPLFKPLQLGAIPLSHRIVMPPLTRMRAGLADGVPSPLAAIYYSQRATEGGLIVAEATQISQQGQGYPQTPGIYTPEQVAGWRTITDATKKRGAVIFLQLWHVGRISHSSLQRDGGLPVAPSAIPVVRQNQIRLKTIDFFQCWPSDHRLGPRQLRAMCTDGVAYRREARPSPRYGYHPFLDRSLLGCVFRQPIVNSILVISIR